jgi:hypothetical protein
MDLSRCRSVSGPSPIAAIVQGFGELPGSVLLFNPLCRGVRLPGFGKVPGDGKDAIHIRTQT